MYSAAILAALLLFPISSGGMIGRDAACRVSRSDKVQATAANENPQEPATSPAPENAAGQQPPESKPEAPPSVAKTDEPLPQKPPASRPKSSAHKSGTRSKKPVTPPAENEPRKVVIHQGGTSAPVAQMLPGISPEEASRQRESAEQLLDAAETSLQQLAARFLHPKQQDTVVQIRQYIDGARSALKENDTQRARTLAQKAYLLSADLVKH